MNPSFDRVKQWRKDNPEKYAEQRKRAAGYLAQYYKTHSTEARARFLFNRYGLTIEEYNAILSQQSGVCAICLNECTTKRHLSVDHCHETNKNRGLLCKNCNIGLGMFLDNKELLQRAQAYLEKHECV